MKTFTKLFKHIFFLQEEKYGPGNNYKERKSGNAFGKYTESIIYRKQHPWHVC